MASEDKLASNTTKEDLYKFLCNKAEKHLSYSIYGRRSAIEKILDSKSLYLSTGEVWNDVSDKNRFNNDDIEDTRFGICFSFMRSENIAMWMLYGGLNKDGAMLRIKGKTLKKILENKRVELGYWDKETRGFCSYCPPKFIDVNYTRIDILYVKEEDNGAFTIKRSDERLENVDEDLFNGSEFMIKDIAWNYENEVRLIVSIKKDVLNEFTIQPNMIRISFEDLDGKDIKEGISITDAPNVEINHYNASCFGNGQIDWNLCKNCNKEKTGRKDT